MIVIFYPPEVNMEEIKKLAKPIGAKFKCGEGKDVYLYITEVHYGIMGYDKVKEYLERVHLIHKKMEEMPQSFLERHMGKFIGGLIIFQLVAFTLMGNFLTGFLMACFAVFILYYKDSR